MRCILLDHRQRERPAMPLLRRADRVFRDRPITCLKSRAETAAAARWSSASRHVRSSRSCPGRDAVRIARVALVATKRCNVAVWPQRFWAGSFASSCSKTRTIFVTACSHSRTRTFSPFKNQIGSPSRSRRPSRVTANSTAAVTNDVTRVGAFVRVILFKDPNDFRDGVFGL